jgi:hypothetical protein
MKMSDEPHASAAVHPGKGHRYLFIRRLVGWHIVLDVLEK